MGDSMTLYTKHPNIRTLILLFTYYVLLALTQTTSAQDVSLATLRIPLLAQESDIVLAPVVYPTWDVSHLGERIGYLEMTAWFGQGGNTVLAGHATTPDLIPSTWYNLEMMEAGDAISVVADNIEYQYAVAGIYRVADTDISLVLPMNEERLTLMTCDVSSWNGVTFTRRIIVVALPTVRIPLN
jgi:LPXTG-site transpeptidase (sortase) family protein